MFHGNLSVDTAKGLKELRKRIQKAKIPPSVLDKSINIATWNIREFGRKKRRKESFHYIAEILYQFDIIAIVELRRNLSQLRKVMDILGPYWNVVYSDYTPDYGGNWERFAYLFDTRVVAFTGLASELDPPRKKNKKTKEYEALFSWWRNPFIASFRAGNFDFVVISAHIRWGDKAADRIKPLELLAKMIAKRRKDSYGTDKDIILMGDFNIPKIGDPLFKAITGEGLRMPKGLLGTDHGSNLKKNKRYDQILHFPSETKCFTDKAGVLDFYTGGIKKLYQKNTPGKEDFTFELSDHLPLWIQMNVDLAEEKLDQILNKGK